MAQTYGEILESAFSRVWDAARAGSETLFLDIGSGRGLIVAASVQQGGCGEAIGLEKYSDKYEESLALRSSLSPDLQPKITFLKGDINDVDLLQLMAGSQCTELLAFCNNLAFNQGTNNRMGKQLLRVMDALPATKFTVVATTPLAALKDRLQSTIFLDMTWGPQHESSVYAWHGGAAVQLANSGAA